jgi:hypothetical protein
LCFILEHPPFLGINGQGHHSPLDQQQQTLWESPFKYPQPCTRISERSTSSIDRHFACILCNTYPCRDRLHFGFGARTDNQASPWRTKLRIQRRPGIGRQQDLKYRKSQTSHHHPDRRHRQACRPSARCISQIIQIRTAANGKMEQIQSTLVRLQKH